MSLLIAGFLIDFISLPVIAGFTSAAAITIATGQVKSLLGITVANGKDLFFVTCGVFVILSMYHFYVIKCYECNVPLLTCSE
jgi:MFS superfamily sulfate permease-like transporter